MANAIVDRAVDVVVPFAPFLRRAETRPPLEGWSELLWRQIPLSFLFWWLASLIPVVGLVLYALVLIPLAARAHWRAAGIGGAAARAAVALRYFVVILIGFGGIRAFVGHTLLADEIAAGIGWPAGSPFQTELAFASLGLGVAGLLAIWIRDHLITAIVIAKSIFWYGAGLVHIVDAAVHRNFSPLNVGGPLIGDLVFPTLLLWLLWRAGGRAATETEG